MAQIKDWRPLITRYLLGELAEEQQREFEEIYFAIDELFAFLLEVEAELIERYASGNLRVDERERFEKYFLKSAERRRLARQRMIWKFCPPSSDKLRDEWRTIGK